MASGRAKNGHLVFSVSSSSAQHDAVAMVSRCSQVERFGSDGFRCLLLLHIHSSLLRAFDWMERTSIYWCWPVVVCFLSPHTWTWSKNGHLLVFNVSLSFPQHAMRMTEMSMARTIHSCKRSCIMYWFIPIWVNVCILTSLLTKFDASYTMYAFMFR